MVSLYVILITQLEYSQGVISPTLKYMLTIPNFMPQWKPNFISQF